MRRTIGLKGALLALVLLGSTPALAQSVAPLQAPDVTNLVAPNGGDSSSVPNPGDENSADSAGTASGDQSGDSGGDATPPPDQPASPCGNQPLTIARMAWPSAALLAEIHARVLKAQFGCTVTVLQTDQAPALSGMAASGQPAVAPEMWISRVADQWNQAVKDQKLRQVGVSYAETTFEGWFVPGYVLDAHPELKSIAALKTDAPLFAEAGQKPKFISCPPDWACAVINRNLLKANGLDTLFDVVEPKNRFDLDQTIAAAVSRKQPIVFYYWQPNATLAQFDFRPIDLGSYSADDFACLGKRTCADPKPSSFAPEPVVIALAQWVFTGAPQVAAYFQRAQMPIKEMNTLLQALNEPGASVESVADSFVAQHADIWQRWLGNPQAATAPASGAAAPVKTPAATPSTNSAATPPKTPVARPPATPEAPAGFAPPRPPAAIP